MLHFLRRLFLGWRAPVRLGRRTIAVPIILAALLLCCASVFVWALVDTSLRQAGVLPTYTPTATRPPTDTPSPTLPPTATPVPPTVTLAPTATATPAPVEPSPAPLPTSTPVPTDPPARPSPTSEPATSAPAPDETAYAAAMPAALQTLGAGLAIVQEQLKKIAAGTAQDDPGWADKTAIGMAQVRLGVQQVRALTAPPKYELVQGQLLLATDHYENSINLLETALTEGDLVKLGQAVDAMTLAGDFINRAQELWDAEASPPAGAAPTAQAVPADRGRPSAAASDCDCTADTLNCPDFEAWDAQACFLRCRELTGSDVHGLDGDNDGQACEWKD